MKQILIAALPLLALSVAACTDSTAQVQDADDASSAVSVTRSALAPGRFISQDDFTRAAEETVNGVVSVKSYVTPRQAQRGGYSDEEYFMDPFEFFFGTPRRRQQPRQQQQQPREEAKPRQIGLGSGVIISEDGYIVTNNHVIADAERLEVTLNDNRNFEATVIGADPTTDLALIKIEAPKGALHVIPMGDSENLKLGEWVLAVGNPFGFTSSVTSGIVSAKARNISSATGSRPTGGIESYIQTDAAVNSGNSGGALVNLKGELVGINTAIYSKTGTYAGCSFAIPTSIVKKVVADLNSYGTVQRAYLGISFRELTPELVAEENIKGVTKGIRVEEVVDRSAAKEGGLKQGDIIVELNSIPVGSTAELQETITRFSPGDRVEIIFYRDGKKMKTTVTMRNSQGKTGITKANSSDSLGATLAEVGEDTCRRLEISGGVAVAEVEDGGRFGEAGIRDGFIILSINNVRVTKPEDVKTIYKNILNGSDRDKVMFITGIYPSGKVDYYAVKLTD